MSFCDKIDREIVISDDAKFVFCGEAIFERRLPVGRELKDVTFRAIKDSDKLFEARCLLNDRYGFRGYGATHDIPFGANHTTFSAEVDESVVGTITLAVDSEHGLNLDHTFSAELADIRRIKGSNICELTKFAFHPDARSREVMAGLFHFAFIYGTMVRECTDLLIEVNPRHVLFYEKMLGFERMGTVKTNGSVAAPAQLMALKVDAIRRSISKWAGRAEPTAHRSLYCNFFPPVQEEQVRSLLSYSSTPRYERHDSQYFKRGYFQSTREGERPAGSQACSDPMALVAQREWDATGSSDVCRAA